MLPLTEAEQQFLLQLARRTLQEKVQLQPGPPLPKIPATLEKPSGAFVTLRQAGNLRGCIGRVEAVMPLYQTVCECALSAALQDPRFDPVRPEEVPYLRIGISVLSSLQDSRPEEVEVGRHGLYISCGLRRGLLLPQVAVEWNWDRNRFLEETCLKAGLPPDAWRRGSRIQTFTAQVFEEQEPIERALTRTG